MEDWRESDLTLQGMIALLDILEREEEDAQISILLALQEEVGDRLRKAVEAKLKLS